jgi:hypothetical protein
MIVNCGMKEKHLIQMRKVGGTGGNRALRKEPIRVQQAKPRLHEPVNGSNGNESCGHDKGQNTECRQQLERMRFIL